MKEFFEAPIVEVVKFSANDAIVTFSEIETPDDEF